MAKAIENTKSTFPSPRFKPWARFKPWVRKTIIILPVITVAILLIVKYLLPQQSYPSVSKQRKTLKNKPSITPFRVLDSVQIVDDLKFLSGDSCAGRQPGTKGHRLAVNRILMRMRQSALDSFNSSLIQNFEGKIINMSLKGQNIVGWVRGTAHPDKFIVISAHYDHIGKDENGNIFYGASDNASGSACLLALAKHFKQYPHAYSLIFAAFDREESGMEGATYFVENNSSDTLQPKIIFNLNLDMIARGTDRELFVSGISHNPSLKYIVDELQQKTNSKILMGHDRGGGYHDWTDKSDHYPFYEKHIPFLYLGTEDHPDYHKTTDSFDKIDLNDYIENCNLAFQMLLAIKL